MSNLALQAEKLREEYQVDVRVLGIADSGRMLLCNTPHMDLGSWQQNLETQVGLVRVSGGGWSALRSRGCDDDCRLIP